MQYYNMYKYIIIVYDLYSIIVVNRYNNINKYEYEQSAKNLEKFFCDFCFFGIGLTKN